MQIDCIRIYAEVLEQGLDFKNYILKSGYCNDIINIYTKKTRTPLKQSDSLIDKIRKCKDVDVLISAISDNKEYPILMVEYSTAVPTDDHKMQRSDVYFWSAIYKVPILKIYPYNKGMAQQFGGGDKINDEIEIALAYNFGALFFPIQWETIENTDTLETKDNALSCIYYNHEITSTLAIIIDNFSKTDSYSNYYDSLKNIYAKKYDLILKKYDKTKLCSIITNSNRFKWHSNSLITKINRFGHAMDPDRGILYFTNMLLGIKNCITEFQINRNCDFNSRGGYKSLFDGVSKEKLLCDYVKNIIETKNNIFDDNDALYIFEQALNIDGFNIFEKIDNHKYIIADDKLNKFLKQCPSITAKCIFLLSSKLILTDINRNIICQISWNGDVIKEYFNSINSINYTPIEIKQLTHEEAKEDIITFASVELYKKMNCKLIAVSYPGAQGDRCILNGEGRKVLREYIDIIAYQQNDDKIIVFLEECKENIINSTSDIKKLNNIINSKEKKQGLMKLLNKTSNIQKIDNINISLGAKLKQNMQPADVDYIFMFEIDNSNETKTLINYTIAIINTSIINSFKSFIDDSGRLKGTLIFDKIYAIK